MDMKRLLQNNKIILLLILLAAVIMIILIGFQISTYRQLQSQLESKEEELYQAQVRLNHLQRLREEGPAFQERLDVFEQLMPGEPKQEELLEFFYQAAQDNSLQLWDVQFEDAASKEGYTEIPLQLSLEGNYHHLLYLLEDLQKADRAIRIDRVGLGRLEEQQQLRAEINLSTFHRNDE